MPGSTRHGKKEIRDWVESQDIKSIVDVGCGSGTYYRLLGSKYKWIGLDIWGPYIDQFKLRDLYDEVHIGEAGIVDWSKLPADLVIFGDVLEHMKKDDAIKTLLEASVYYPHVVVSIPLSDDLKFDSQMHYNNPYEKHVSFWKYEEMAKLLPWERKGRVNNIGVYMI